MAIVHDRTAIFFEAVCNWQSVSTSVSASHQRDQREEISANRAVHAPAFVKESLSRQNTLDTAV